MLKHIDQDTANRFEDMYVEVSGQTDQEQIADANNFWRIQLSSLSVSTIDARTCLDDDLSVTSWMTYFKTEVMPVIREHRLPNRE